MADNNPDVKREFHRTSETSSTPAPDATVADDVKASTERAGTESAVSSPAVTDVKSTESTTDKTHSESVPYARFKEVNDEVKALRAEVQTLKQTPTTQPAKEKTWDDLSVEELRKSREYFRNQGNDEGVDFVNDKIAERTARDIANEHVQRNEFNRVRVESWQQTVGEFPDLRNPQSEHYRRTLDLVRSDPRLDREADGHAVAARLVAAQLLREELAQANKAKTDAQKRVTGSATTTALESGRRAGPSSSSLDTLREAAENSGRPDSVEWRKYLSALDKTKKAQSGT